MPTATTSTIDASRPDRSGAGGRQRWPSWRFRFRALCRARIARTRPTCQAASNAAAAEMLMPKLNEKSIVPAPARGAFRRAYHSVDLARPGAVQISNINKPNIEKTEILVDVQKKALLAERGNGLGVIVRPVRPFQADRMSCCRYCRRRSVREQRSSIRVIASRRSACRSSISNGWPREGTARSRQ